MTIFARQKIALSYTNRVLVLVLKGERPEKIAGLRYESKDNRPQEGDALSEIVIKHLPEASVEELMGKINEVYIDSLHIENSEIQKLFGEIPYIPGDLLKIEAAPEETTEKVKALCQRFGLNDRFFCSEAWYTFD